MDRLASSIFRRYFAKLDAPTIVTVNGHAIGTWTPTVTSDGSGMRYIDTAALHEAPVKMPDGRVITEVRRGSQASRDAILRKINSRPK